MEKQKHSKLQFRIDIVLTVLFIGVIFFVPICTVVFEHGLLGHAIDMRYVGRHLEDSNNYTVWDLIQASIDSLEGYIARDLYGMDDLGKVSSNFQYMLGKRLVSTGNTQMIRLNTGHLYDLQSEMSMKSAGENVISMRNIVPEDTPFLFVYEHPTLYDEETQMPEGYEFLDFSTQEADEIVGMLRDAKVDLLDSREVLRATGLPLEDYLMYTDQHWSTRAAIIMAQAIAERAQERTGAQIPVERLDIDQFEATRHPKLFLGKYGLRIGTLMIDPDDIVTYTPRYDTNIQLKTSNHGNVSEREGRFEDVMLRQDALIPDAGRSWNSKAYIDYGLVEDYDLMHNPDGGDCSILLLKDSYSAAIGRFLSLVAKDVYSIDMRTYNAGTLAGFVEKYHPDIVVVAYSLQMLRNEDYEFE